jgi:hypothetical protein
VPSAAVRVRLAGLLLVCLALTGSFNAQSQQIDPDLIAHEWGTFTSIADKDGRAVRWMPLRSSADLPRFVEHIMDAQFKVGLAGTVRMETPVLYFYSSHETKVSVSAKFSRGILTEWYPYASEVKPNPKTMLDREALFRRKSSGSIAWNSVTVSPKLAANFPRASQPGDPEDNLYYRARETAAAPLLVKTDSGDQQEKFLFYRGVSTFSLPISTTITASGQVRLANLAQDEVPSVILFERRGDKLGYRLGGALAGEMSLDPPELTATFESLSRDLQDVLIGQGLYADEAHAMIETWRQSWFEEGSRLFYIVPKNFLNGILPLTINPAPEQTVRVFVGRLELVTPATTQAIEQILAAHDKVSLQKYDRFLEPILKEMREADPAGAEQRFRDLELTNGWTTATPATQK